MLRDMHFKKDFGSQFGNLPLNQGVGSQAISDVLVVRPFQKEDLEMLASKSGLRDLGRATGILRCISPDKSVVSTASTPGSAGRCL